MSKTAIIGDVHLSGFQSDPIDRDGLPKRLGVIINSLKFVLDYCREHQISCLEIAGDLIHDKSIMYTDAQTIFSDLILEYLKDEFRIRMIPGNHDMSSTGELQRSSVEIFKGFPNVDIIVKPIEFQDVFYLPWSHSIYEDLKKYKGDSKILVSHFGLNEARLQSGLSVKTRVQLKDLHQFKLVLLGHYHLPQMVDDDYTTLYYTGSLCHRDWNDKNEQKRFLVYDTETLEVESVPFSGFPEYREYVIRSKEEAPAILEQAERDKNFGHEVRIRKDITDEVEVPHDLIVIQKQEEIDVTNRGVSISQTDKEKAYKYMEIKGIPEEERDEYFQYLLDENILDDTGE